MLIVGEKEQEEGSVSVRKHGEGDKGSYSLDDFKKLIETEVNNSFDNKN